MLKELPLLTKSRAVPGRKMSTSVPAVLRCRDAVSLDSSAGETVCLAALQTLHPDWGQLTALRVSSERRKLDKWRARLHFLCPNTGVSIVRVRGKKKKKKYGYGYTCSSAYISEKTNKNNQRQYVGFNYFLLYYAYAYHWSFILLDYT